MTDPTDLIARADAALDGVTDGPWSQAHRRKSNGMFSTEIYRDDDADNTIASICWHAVPYPGGVTTDRPENARFIAASRQLVPALRDALAAALTRADEWESACHAAQEKAFAAIDKRNEMTDAMEGYRDAANLSKEAAQNAITERDAALTRAKLAECHAEAMDGAHERELFDAARVAIEMQMDAPNGQHVNPQRAVDEVIAARAVLDGKAST